MGNQQDDAIAEAGRVLGVFCLECEAVIRVVQDRKSIAATEGTLQNRFYPEWAEQRDALIERFGVTIEGELGVWVRCPVRPFQWPNEWCELIERARSVLPAWDESLWACRRAVDVLTPLLDPVASSGGVAWSHGLRLDIQAFAVLVPRHDPTRGGEMHPPFARGDELLMPFPTREALLREGWGIVESIRGRLRDIAAVAEAGAGVEDGAAMSGTIWMAPGEIATLLNKSRSTITNEARLGKINARQPGGAGTEWQIDAESAAERWATDAGALRDRIANERVRNRP